MRKSLPLKVKNDDYSLRTAQRGWVSLHGIGKVANHK